MRIVVDHLNYEYNAKSKSLSVKALEDICLTIEEGEFYGIIGHTGSGKSTFLQHLNGLIKMGKDSGSILIGDFDLSDKKCDYKALRSKVGMVFQYPEYQLFAETVKDDVAFGIKNFLPTTSQEKVEEMVKDAITLVGLDYDEVKDKSPFELSGGQKRRVAIAGVIVTKPEVLVLDEPVAGLDPKGKKDFLELLTKLKSAFVKTIIIVSHDMNVVAEYCTRLAVFNGGKILLTGTPKEVFSQSDKLKEAGMLLPLTAYLTQRLKDCGRVVENDFTTKDFISKIADLLKGEK